MDTSTVLETIDPASVAAEVVARFAALADPTRLAILLALSDQQRCVCEVNDVVPVAANVLSYHLRVLREAGLVTATRRGRWIDYALDDEGLAAARVAVPGDGSIVAIPPSAAAGAGPTSQPPSHEPQEPR